MVLTQVVVVGVLTVVALGPGQDAVNREQRAADKPFDSRDRPLAQGGPYAKLFTAPQGQNEPFKFQVPNEWSTLKPDQRPKVICGMVTVPVTPDLDAKMVVTRKADAKTESKIRMIEPKICTK